MAPTTDDSEIAKTQEERKKLEEQLASLTSVTFDTDLYGAGIDNRFEGYELSIPVNEDEDAQDPGESVVAKKVASYTAPKSVLNDMPMGGSGKDEDLGFQKVGKAIVDREDDYRRRRLNQVISPDRNDAFAMGDRTPDIAHRTYADVMREEALKKEREETLKEIAKKRKEKEEESEKKGRDRDKALVGDGVSQVQKRRNRWDQNQETSESKKAKMGGSEWDMPDSSTPGIGRWDATPGRVGDAMPSLVSRRNRWDETPTPGRAAAGSDSTPTAGGATPGATPAGMTWDATPKLGGLATPTPKRQRSRWDETPATMGSATPISGGATPAAAYPPGQTPVGGIDLDTPTPGAINLRGAITPEQYNLLRWEKDIEERNRALTDEELDCLFPQNGYKILDPPASYVPIRTPARKLLATPTPMSTPLYSIPVENRGQQYDVPKEAPGDLPYMKPEDYQHFKLLLDEVDEEELTPDEQKERKIMKLLLKVKNGTPAQRKIALRQLTDKAREFGAGPLFNKILPLLMQPTLEDQERHLLVKVIDRVLYKLDELVRPFVHKILVVIEPLLIDEDYYARVEGREIISNLSKAAGLATMIAAMRPDIDNIDEYVRNTTARAFSVVASALGIPALLPFLKAVCQSKKSWQARHTGIKIVQQIAILIGCAVLPHLRSLVEIIEHGLNDENQKVRTITALSLASLAEASAPYGIESFDSVLKPLWKGIRSHRGKVLAAFLKAIGFIIPLMDALYASYYTKEVMFILIREFQSPDEEMKKIVLKVVKQCVSTEGVEADYIRSDILPEFFKNFWIRRMALDRRNYKQLVETTVEIANKVGASDIVGRVVEDLKDESEPYRRMVMETIEKVVVNLGASDIDARLEELLIDGILYAFQEQTSDDANVMLNGFGAVVNALGQRVKPYLPQICGTIKWRLNNKSAKVRQQAADLISRIAAVMKECQEEQLMGHLGVVLYEYLGEEYPEVLGSILGALKAIVNVIGMSKMTPPIKDLLPRITPILKNRHEKVQENCIDLVGRIADRGAEFVPAREWMRICFELLEMLKAHKKGIRRATVTHLVAIAIVAETCSPFTVLPALMNEYRVPELNVQNGVLKSLSFLFEYIGEMGKDYIYAVTPLLEDALMDRDLVHRQTAASAVKHMALGVAGLGCEDALVHLLNYVWPNIFETSPHVINAVMEAIEGMRVALGAAAILNYCLQGLFHPARKVREVYWKIFNSLYIGAQDALVAAYPVLEDETSNILFGFGGFSDASDSTNLHPQESQIHEKLELNHGPLLLNQQKSLIANTSVLSLLPVPWYLDVVDIRNLSLVYALAGVDCIDCAADAAVVSAVNEGIDVARGIVPVKRPWVMISVNDDEDLHFRKAEFDPEECPPDCSKPCEMVCPANAISLSSHGINPSGQLEGGVIIDRCYGCGRCLPVCPYDNIRVITYVRDATATSELLKRNDVDALEIHTSGRQSNAFEELWDNLEDSIGHVNLVAVSLPNLGDSTASSMNKMYSIMNHQLQCCNLWQLDGRPMSGDIGRGATRAAINFAIEMAALRDKPHGNVYMDQNLANETLPTAAQAYSRLQRKSVDSPVSLHVVNTDSAALVSNNRGGISRGRGGRRNGVDNVGGRSNDGFLQLAGGTNFHTVDGLKKVGLFQTNFINENSSIMMDSVAKLTGSSPALVGGIAYGGYARKIVGRVLNKLRSQHDLAHIEHYPEYLLEALVEALKLVGTVKCYNLPSHTP
ncbi:hypothetical protein GIB67_001308 [Kingdonia uniflora]|uniref:4Fe-4S ferredoxin-type domain-containing protein n=1 Tax=Kingdonia uniflora TaxID=39325 RepID=A0A7J7LLI6_9MAGN|nr:hypothetical protein GIB67_001308 [Kingdonia uniflora]